MATRETQQLLAAAVAAAEDKKAEDLRILELDPAESGLTDYFLLMTGSNPRQIQTLADEIELKLKRDFGQYAHSREGYKQAEWVLLDYVDFVVHIFSREKREFYGLERLRKTATGVDADQLQRTLTERTAESRTTAESRSTGEAAAVRKARRPASASPVKQALRKPAKRATRKTAAAGRTGAKSSAKAATKKSARKPAAKSARKSPRTPRAD